MSDSEEFWSAEEDNVDTTYTARDRINKYFPKLDKNTKPPPLSHHMGYLDSDMNESLAQTTKRLVEEINRSSVPHPTDEEMKESTVPREEDAGMKERMERGEKYSGMKERIVPREKYSGMKERIVPREKYSGMKERIVPREIYSGMAPGGQDRRKEGTETGREGKEREEGMTPGEKDKNEVVTPLIEPEELERIKSEVLERKETGNNLFRSGEFAAAMDAYSAGLEMCPRQLPTERSVLLSNRAVCHEKLGEDQLSLSDCTEALELAPDYVKVRQRRAETYERLGKLEEALQDYTHLLKIDPDNKQARQTVPRLSVEVETQREQMKTEAVTKLKELGNMILNPFGISTNDFNFVQDPKTGGYSVSFGKKT